MDLNENKEILHNVKEVFSDILENFSIKPNFEVICDLTKAEAKKGITKNITVDRQRACNNCFGINKQTCGKCQGLGFFIENETITVDIPCRIKEGTYIIIKGKGNQTKANEEYGDLYIKIHIFGNKRENDLTEFIKSLKKET